MSQMVNFQNFQPYRQTKSKIDFYVWVDRPEKQIIGKVNFTENVQLNKNIF